MGLGKKQIVVLDFKQLNDVSYIWLFGHNLLASSFIFNKR